jgi:hypothetical protein
MRNGLSVTPAMGATNTEFANSKEPMRMREEKWKKKGLLKKEARFYMLKISALVMWRTYT